MKERKSGEVMPFVLFFREPLREEDIIDAQGKYNEEKQVWELEGERGDSSKLIMSGISPEAPPTTCIRGTRISPTTTISDTVVDD